MSDVAREIDETLAAWAAALKDGDLEAVASLVTRDAEFWSHGEPPLVGRRALVEAFEPFVEAYVLDQRWDEEERWVGAEWAFIRGTEVNTLTPRDGGDPTVVRQRAFSLLRRGEDGRWRFARGMTNPGPESAAPETG